MSSSRITTSRSVRQRYMSSAERIGLVSIRTRKDAAATTSNLLIPRVIRTRKERSLAVATTDPPSVLTSSMTDGFDF
jgi:hypothetical protein